MRMHDSTTTWIVKARRFLSHDHMGAIKLFERFADPRECLNLIGRGVSLGIATGCSLGRSLVLR